MKLVCLGDSLTYGYGVPRRDCWVSLCAERTGHTLVNRGITGDTAGGMLSRFGRDVLNERPDRVLIMGGANDIFLTGSDLRARADLGALVHQSVAAGIRPMLGLPIPLSPALVPPPWTELTDFFALEPVFRAYRDWLLRFAGIFRIQTVDFSLAGLLRRRRACGCIWTASTPQPGGHRLMADGPCAAPAAHPSLEKTRALLLWRARVFAAFLRKRLDCKTLHPLYWACQEVYP